MQNNKKVACSWSCGKDSCLALYKAKQMGFNVCYIFNFISSEYGRVSFHGTKADLVKLQAEALDITLLQKETTRENYEDIFRETLRELKELGITYIVRGDIHLQDLKDWVNDICKSEGIEVISPLWEKVTLDILNEFVELGFKAVVTSAQADKLDKTWIGRTIDKDFIREIKDIKGIDPCGENGEYHSFVYDGPIFSKKINIAETHEIFKDGFWFLDIRNYYLEEKGGER